MTMSDVPEWSRTSVRLWTEDDSGDRGAHREGAKGGQMSRSKKTTSSPKRVLTMNSHQAMGLHRLLLGILDGNIGQGAMTWDMACKLFNLLQEVFERSPYDKEERTKAGYRRFATGSLPEVHSVREVHSFMDPHRPDHIGSFTLIAPDTNTGKENVYSVLRVDYQTGQTRVLGREVHLQTARRLALRPAYMDTKPL
jgi:hypothetical protein